MAKELALITGAGRGIGRSIAELLARHGHAVVLVARNQEELDATRNSIISVGGEAYSFVCDVSDSSSVARLSAEVSAIGVVTTLVNNAGVAPSAKLDATTDQLWSDTIAVNLSGPFYMSRAFAPLMKSAGGGKIINIASTAAFEGYAYTSAYVASKHGLLGLTRALAVELARQNIQSFAVCPGFVRTRIVEESVERLTVVAGKSREEAEAQFAGMNKEGRLIEPREIADTVWRLVSENRIPSGKAVDAHGMLLD